MWPNPQETVDLVTFTEKVLNGKFHFLCSDSSGFIIVVLFFAFLFHAQAEKQVVISIYNTGMQVLLSLIGDFEVKKLYLALLLWPFHILSNYASARTNILLALCEMCPNTDQKKLRIWTLFRQCSFHVLALLLQILPLQKF